MAHRTHVSPLSIFLLLAGFLPGHYSFAEYSAVSLSCYQTFTESDFNAAKSHCQLAARNGDSEAQFKLARIFAQGRGKKKDLSASLEWLGKAAEQGHTKAQYNLGLSYYHGSGVEKDLKLAAKWYRDAALNGHAKSQRTLARMYESGMGVNQDSHKAYLWYLKTAEQGISRGQLKVGLMLLDGEGVAPNRKEAAIWIAKSANGGDADGQFFLAEMLILKKPHDAVVWYQKAIKQNHVPAMFNLAAHLNSENSTISQLQEAWQLADSAVKAGNEDSVVLIELIEQKIAAYDSRVDEDISEQVPAARDPAMNLDTEWLMSLSPESYTIQLVSLSSLENVDKFINQSGLQNTARHFPTQLKAGLIHIIVYGEYGSKADATRALIDLPDHLRKIGPYVRKIEVLQRDFSDNKP